MMNGAGGPIQNQGVLRKSSRAPWTSLLMAATLIGAQPLEAQITGTVTDAAGQGVPGVQVSLNGTRFATFTNESGRFNLIGVPPGRHQLMVLQVGFQSHTETVDVIAGQSTRVDIQLRQDLIVLNEIFVSQPRPVYNVVLSPLATRDPIRVVAEEPTRLTFSIGPADEASVLGGDATISEVIAAAEDTTRLSVLFECFVCLEEKNQLTTIFYDPDDGVSDSATFEFTARRAAVSNTGGLGRVALSVLKDAVEIDRIEVPMIVGQGTEVALTRYRPPSVHQVNDIPATTYDPPDLVIYIPEPGNDAIKMRFAAQNSVLASRLDTALGRPVGSFLLETGVDEADLEQLAARIYQRMSQIVSGKNPALDSVYIGTVVGAVATASSSRLKGADSAGVVDALEVEGRNLYRRVFRHGELALRGVIETLEAYGRERSEAGDPLHIRIHNSGPWVPWQLLSSTQEGAQADPNRFWGLRYALGIQKEMPGIDGPIATTIETPYDEDLVLATHRHDDAVRQRADSLLQRMARLANASVLRHDESELLLTELEDQASYLKVLLFFTHGSSGASEPGQYLRPPELIFSDTDRLSTDRVDALADEHPSMFPFFLSQPLVFLNACESGTGGLEPTTNNNFVASFLRLGASTVIATESSVWVGFAYGFANDFMLEVFEGRSMAEAMQRTRRKHLAERGNALGLVYSLYGNPSARILPSDNGGEP